MSDYVTKSELKTELAIFREDFRKELMEDFQRIVNQIIEISDKRFAENLERLDRHIAQNALEHNKFDDRMHKLEQKPA